MEDQHRWVSWWMLFSRRQYVIDHIKTPVMKAVITLDKGISWWGTLIALAQIVYYAKRYPEPTKAHTMLPRTHLLIDVWEEFNENNSARQPLFNALWRMFIIEYEHDPFYRYRIDWIIRTIMEKGWGKDALDAGNPHWKKK